jgi:hypothetical protein
MILINQDDGFIEIILTRRVVNVILLDGTNLWITKAVLVDKSTGQGKDTTMNGRHTKALERWQFTVVTAQTRRYALNRTGPEQVRVTVDDPFGRWNVRLSGRRSGGGGGGVSTHGFVSIFQGD